MANELANAMDAIATVAGGVTGINFSTGLPRDTQVVDPFGNVYLLEDITDTAVIGSTISLSKIAIDILKDRKDLVLALAALRPFLDSVKLALLSEKTGNRFGGTILTFGRVHTMFIPNVTYGGIDRIGFRFILEDVKIMVNI